MSWLCLGVSWFLSVMCNAYMIVPASILPRIMEDLALGPAVAIWVMSIALAGWILTNFGLGMAIDRVGDVQIIIVACVGLLAMAVWSWRAGLEGHLSGLLLSRFLAGVVMAAIWTGLANLVGRIFTDELQGISLGLFTTSAPGGVALGQFSGPWVAGFFHWSVNFLLLGGLVGVGLIGLLAVLWLGSFEQEETSVPGLGEFGSVLTRSPVLFAAAMAFTVYSLFLFLNGWMPTYLSREFSLSLEVSGLITAVFTAMGLLARSGGGLLSDRLFGQRRMPVIKLSLLLTLPLILLLGFIHHLVLMVILLVTAGFTIQLSMGILYAYVREVVATNVTGTALAFLASSGTAGGFTAPVIAGWLIERSGTYATSFGYALVMVLVGLTLTRLAPESSTMTQRVSS